MKYFFILLLSLSLQACRGTGDAGGSGSTTATFTKSTALSFSVSRAATGLLIGKFTTDSYPDLVMTSTGNGAEYYKNQSGASWATVSTLSAGTFTKGLAINLNADASDLSDIVLYGSNQLFNILNTGGSGGFASSSISSGTALSASSVQSLTFADTTAGAGFIIIGGGASQISWMGQSSGTFGSENNATPTSNVETGVMVLTGDINSDGKTDFAIIPRTGSNPIEFWINSGNTTFVKNAVTISPASTDTIYDSALIDMNGDDKPDLVLATDNGLDMYVNSSASSASISFSTSTALSTFTGSFRSMVVADFTGDGRPDIFLGKSSSTGALLSQRSTLSFKEITSTAFGSDLASAPSHVYAADLNADGRLDLIELNSSGIVTVHLNQGS